MRFACLLWFPLARSPACLLAGRQTALYIATGLPHVRRLGQIANVEMGGGRAFVRVCLRLNNDVLVASLYYLSSIYIVAVVCFRPEPGRREHAAAIIELFPYIRGLVQFQFFSSIGSVRELSPMILAPMPRDKLSV